MTFTVSLNRPSPNTITVNYATSIESGDTATFEDFSAASDTLSFTSGETSKVISVAIVDDILGEPDDTFRGTLISPSGADIADGTATGTIVDNDGGPASGMVEIDIDDLFDEFEEIAPGRVIPLNDDDDDNNSSADLNDSGGSEDDDLVHANLAITILSGASLASWRLTLSVLPDSPVKIWTSAAKTTRIASGTQFVIGSLDPNLYFPNDIYIEGVTAGLCELNVTLADPTGIQAAVDKAKVTVIPPVDLDAFKVKENVADDLLDEDIGDFFKGAYVPINNDDDAYSALFGLDKDVPLETPIPGETDLLPIMLHSINPASLGGEWVLFWSGPFHVWTNPNRTGLVTALAGNLANATKFDATVDRTLYVEATGTGGGILTLCWSDGTRVHWNRNDQIKVTSFETSGPINVPDYSIYRYAAIGGHAGELGWLAPSGGTIVYQLPT